MSTNRVDKVLVTSGTEKESVALLAAGDYVVLVDGKAANTPIVEGDSFRVAVKSLDDSVKYSNTIHSKDIKSIKVEPYAPVVEQVVTVTMDAPVAGLEYTLTLVDRSDKEILQRRQDKRTYQVVAVDGDTADSIAAKFATELSNDKTTFVTASAAGAVLTITAKAKVTKANAAGQFGLQHYFEVGCGVADTREQYTKFGTVAYTVQPDFGSGSYGDVRTLEFESAGYSGFLNRTLFPVIQPSFDSQIGKTYDYIVIEYDNNYWTNSVVAGKVDSGITLVLAVEAGNTEGLETIFEEYI